MSEDLLQIAPSLLSADFVRLEESVHLCESGGADVLHIDVMDGHFVPNITFGPIVVEALRRITTLPLDCHLMIENADDYIPEFAKAGANWISVHVEICPNLSGTIRLIKSFAIKAGVAIKPNTPLSELDGILSEVDYILLMSVNPGFGGQEFNPSLYDRAFELRAKLDRLGLQHVFIEGDGGLKLDNIIAVVNAGVRVIVSGSGLFRAPNFGKRLSEMKAACHFFFNTSGNSFFSDEFNKTVLDFRTLLAKQKIHPRKGFPLDEACEAALTAANLLKSNSAIEYTRESKVLWKAAVGLHTLATAILRHTKHKDFDRIAEHLKLLDEGMPLQNTQSIRDESSNKMFEVLAGSWCMDFSEDVRIEKLKISANDLPNPDVIASFEDCQWGIACKVLNTPDYKPDNLYKLWIEGMEQIQRAQRNNQIERGIVLFNFKNIFDLQEEWPRNNDGTVRIFQSDHEAETVLRNNINNFSQGMVDLLTNSIEVSTYINLELQKFQDPHAFLVYLHFNYLIFKDGKVRPASSRNLWLQRIYPVDLKTERFARALNYSVHCN